ncbi:MAG: hypothetical protein GY842_19170 [bacterium]|nr:hypothetical protein [bacterium]
MVRIQKRSEPGEIRAEVGCRTTGVVAATHHYYSFQEKEFSSMAVTGGHKSRGGKGKQTGTSARNAGNPESLAGLSVRRLALAQKRERMGNYSFQESILLQSGLRPRRPSIFIIRQAYHRTTKMEILFLESCS